MSDAGQTPWCCASTPHHLPCFLAIPASVHDSTAATRRGSGSQLSYTNGGEVVGHGTSRVKGRDPRLRPFALGWPPRAG